MNSPEFTANSPEYTANSPEYTMDNPEYTMNSPVYTINSPVYTMNSPVYAMNSPVYEINDTSSEANSLEYEDSMYISSIDDDVDSLFGYEVDMSTLYARYEGPVLQGTSLCQRCSELDLKRHLERKPLMDLLVDEPFEIDEIDIDPTNIDPSCTLCEVLQSLSRGIKRSFWCQRPEGYREKIVMAMDPTPAASGHHRISIHRGVPSSYSSNDLNWPTDSVFVDWAVLRKNLAECEADHAEVCGAKTGIPVERLRLFNCETRELENATADMEYVALSYVWGSVSMDKPRLPRTIRDALEITLKLGYKYIWIDQLCIDQDQKHSHKKDQIGHMHHIYRNSALTLIAAAGEDSTCGIPGAPETPRRPKTCCQIGDLVLLEKKEDPDVYLRQTRWISRGWTLQEERMSKRVIVFTEREAWFSCFLTPPVVGREFPNSKFVQHGSTQNIERWTSGNAVKASFLPACYMERFAHSAPDGFRELVEAYSRRNLTYDSDVINAFSGILGVFEQADPPVYHIWGSPVSLPLSDCHAPRSSPDGFIRSLSFKKATFRPTTLTRRSDFPGWSWTGWKGPIEFTVDKYTSNDMGTEISVVVERTNGTFLTWPEFYAVSHLRNVRESISRFIRLKAWTMNLRLQWTTGRLWMGKRLCLTFPLSSGNIIEEQVTLFGQHSECLDEEKASRLLDKTYTGILLDPVMIVSSDRKMSDCWDSAYFMLVECGEGYAERVGYFEIRQSDVWGLVGGYPRGVDIESRYHNNKLDINGLQLEYKEIRLG